MEKGRRGGEKEEKKDEVLKEVKVKEDDTQYVKK